MTSRSSRADFGRATQAHPLRLPRGANAWPCSYSRPLMLLDAAPRAEEVSFEGGRYLPTLLGHDELDGYRYTGLALLALGDLS